MPLFFFFFFFLFSRKRGERTSEETKKETLQKNTKGLLTLKHSFGDTRALLLDETTTTTESSSSSFSRTTTTTVGGGGGTGDFSLHFEEKRANAKEEVFLSRLETNGFVVVCRRERFLRATTRGRNTPTCTGPSSALFSRRHHERNAKDERATTSIRRSLRTTKRWW